MSWGPFRPGVEPAEQKAQLRSLRLAAKLLCGKRAAECCYRLLVAEVDTHPETLGRAEAEFDRLAPVDRRRVLSAFQGSLPHRTCIPPEKPGGTVIPRTRV